LPELPEVETTRRGIEPFLQNQLIEFVEVRNGSLRWPVSPEVHELRATIVKNITRRGKYIILHFDKGSVLIHLGMSGSLRVVDSTMAAQKHDHLDFHLASGKIIRFNDPRRFGSVLWAPDWSSHVLIETLGLEPFDMGFTGEYLYQAAQTKKVTAKQFIMNSKLVVGVGNIYANEALFMAGIHPKRAVNRISLKRMNLFVEKIKEVLSLAIEQGGTTLKDFVGSDGKPGYFQQQLYVYGRRGKACKKCGSTLQEIRLNNRSTVFCKHCQT